MHLEGWPKRGTIEDRRGAGRCREGTCVGNSSHNSLNVEMGT